MCEELLACSVYVHVESWCPEIEQPGTLFPVLVQGSQLGVLVPVKVQFSNKLC